MADRASIKKRRHGSVAVILTALVVAAVVLVNAIVTKLALRFDWYYNMNDTLSFPTTDVCYDYLDEYVMDSVSEEEPIRIIFCDEEENIRASTTQLYVLETATELQDHFGADRIRIEYLNIWERPSVARSYGVKASTSVVVAKGEQSRVCTLRDFFLFPVDDTENPTAYNGEKRLAVAMRAVTSADSPVCYFVMNHGESLSDYALMYAATDAGYMVNYLDTLSFDIPEDCELLILCNPTQDLTEVDGVSGLSETDKLNEYLARGGRMMVFVSADTFAAGSFSHLEGFLADWGVTFEHGVGATGVEECYSIRDTAHSLTTDGYTILGKVADTGRAGEMMREVGGVVRLGNATGIAAAEGWSAGDTGNEWSQGDRTTYALLRSYPGAEAWAGGRAVARSEEGFNLLTLTQDAVSGGSVLVCSSVTFVEEDAMQNGSYSNETLLLAAVEAMGKSDTPLHLAAQPLSGDEIHTLTTRQAYQITLLLVGAPVLLSVGTGLVVLIRRRYA